MQRWVFFIGSILILLTGCSPKMDKPVVTIGTIKVNLEEFLRAYESSIFSRIPEGGKKEFLDTFIVRKLVLKEAERMNLDKDPEFLNDIQLFWEQSLMKRVLIHQTDRLTSDLEVTDFQAKMFYEQHRDQEFSGKEYSEIKEELKVLLFQQMQQEVLQTWVKQLRQKATIIVNYQALGITPDQ